MDPPTRPSPWLAWIRLGRPHFLVGGLLFFALGALLARATGHPLSVPAFLLGQATVTAVQLGVHYGNEWHDLAADRLNPVRTRFAGGSRVLLDDGGGVPPRVARDTSRISFAVAAMLLGGVLALQGPLAFGVGAAMSVLAWGYSAPPLRLHSRGTGELAAGLVIAGLVPAFALAVAGAQLDPSLGWTVAPLVLHVAALVTVLSLPDQGGDAAAGKRTLAVRLGPRGARRAIQSAWVVAGLATLASIAAGRPPYVALASGSALSMAIALPILAGTRRWDLLSVLAAALVAVQWLVTIVPLVWR